MARAALVALAWAAAAATASAARYVDYSGVKMPQYGYENAREPAHVAGAAEDYHGHSPDASAPLDYKFEEDTHNELGKSERPSKKLDDRESWSKFARRQRKFERTHDDESLEFLDTYDSEPEEISKIKLSRHLPVQRPQLKSKKSRREGSSRRRPAKHSRRSDRADPDIDYFQEREEPLKTNRKQIDEGMDIYRHTAVTEVIIRRKPRDRHIRDRLGDDREGALDPNRRMSPDRSTEPEYLLHNEDKEGISGREPYRPVIEDEDDGAPSKRRHKAYDNYGDYYDMKRVHNIKNKLPTLLRRTTARLMPPTATSTNVLDALWTHRRAASLAPPAPGRVALSVVPLPPASAVAAATASLAASTTTTPRTIKAMQALPSNASEEISLAEKSRLSILKKAQRKESVRSNFSSVKPPVLLQVTDKRLTVVVVEPPTSEGPWMRAREVAVDTPERVDRAKLLMRHKLVARAKNIQELTDNWDEMVCDYIDVSLLDVAPPAPPAPRATLLLLALALTLLA